MGPCGVCELAVDATDTQFALGLHINPKLPKGAKLEGCSLGLRHKPTGKRARFLLDGAIKGELTPGRKLVLRGWKDVKGFAFWDEVLRAPGAARHTKARLGCAMKRSGARPTPAVSRVILSP